MDNINTLRMRYRNHRGEYKIRYIKPLSIHFESTQWHPDQQWILTAFDVDKSDKRSFALKDCDFLSITDKERQDEEASATKRPKGEKKSINKSSS